MKRRLNGIKHMQVVWVGGQVGWCGTLPKWDSPPVRVPDMGGVHNKHKQKTKKQQKHKNYKNNKKQQTTQTTQKQKQDQGRCFGYLFVFVFGVWFCLCFFVFWFFHEDAHGIHR